MFHFLTEFMRSSEHLYSILRKTRSEKIERKLSFVNYESILPPLKIVLLENVTSFT